MRKFYPHDITSYAHRPTVTYNLGFHIYNYIFEIGGHEMLMYAIENPDKLLSIYNELHTDAMLVPRIPDDIVRIWQENLAMSRND